MKRRITAVTLALLLLMTIVPVTAAAADGNGQTIPVEPDVLFFQGETAQKIPLEITDQDPVVWENYRGKIYEFTLPQGGTLILNLSPTEGTRGTEMIFSESKEIYKAKGAWYPVYGDSKNPCNWSPFDAGTNDFSKSGKAGDKYYLVITNGEDSFKSQTFLRAAFYPAANRTLELGKTYVFGGDPDKKHQDFKFTATQSGYVSVDFFRSTEAEYTLSLLDQNKKRVSGQYDRWVNQAMFFGVEKGKTYYFRISIGRFCQNNRPSVIQLTNYTVKEKSGASLKKAVSVKKNKTIQGYILPGKKASDWYKIKVPKTKKVKFFVRNKFSDQCYFDIYNKSGKKLKTKQKIDKNRRNVRSKTKYVRLPKGTYYIKIYNKTKGDSGGYTLKWK